METPGGMETVKTVVPGSYQVLESVNAFCGVTLTLHQVPILGGDCPSEVTHSLWPQRFQSSREILHFGVTNYQRSQKAYFPCIWLLLCSHLPSLPVAGRALTGTLAQEQCLLALGVPSSGTGGETALLVLGRCPWPLPGSERRSQGLTAAEEHAVRLPSRLRAQLCPDLCPRGLRG